MSSYTYKYIRNKEYLLTLGSVFLLFDILLSLYNKQANDIIVKDIVNVIAVLFHFIPLSIGYKAAMVSNREKFLWAVICFFSPFIGLTILSKLRYKFAIEYREEANKIMNEFNGELNLLKVDLKIKIIDRVLYYQRRTKLEDEYNKRLESLTSE